MSTTASDLRDRASQYRQAAEAFETAAEQMESIDSLTNGHQRGRPKGKGRGRPKGAVATKGKGRGRPKGSKNKNGRGRPKGSKNAPKEGEEGKQTLPDLLHDILKKNRSGLELKLIVQECLDQGYKSKAKDFSNIVYQALNKLVKTEKIVERGEDRKYRLTAAA